MPAQSEQPDDSSGPALHEITLAIRALHNGDERAASSDPVGVRRQIKRKDDVADERERQQYADAVLVEMKRCEVDDEDNRQKAIGEQAYGARTKEEHGIGHDSGLGMDRAQILARGAT